MHSTVTDIPFDNPDIKDLEGLGILLVTDLTALVRPIAGHDPYYRRATHDVRHFSRVMNMGDWDDDQWNTSWHIVTSLPAAEAKRLLHEPLNCYFDTYSPEKSWIDVHVHYQGVSGAAAKAEYGFCDARKVGHVTVYAKEYWQQYDPSGDPTQGDWSYLLEYLVGDRVYDPTGMSIPVDLSIPADKVDLVLAQSECSSPIVVVRPSDDYPGFTARGFNIHPFE